MSKVAVLVKLPATPGRGADLVAAFEDIYREGGLETEAGTLLHVIHQAKDDPDAVYFYELYEDQAALEAHSGGAVLKAIFPKLAGLVAGAPETTVLLPRNGHGLTL